MIYYGIDVAEGTAITNITIPTGVAFPANDEVGELFFRTDENKYYIRNNSGWSEVGSGAGISNVVEDLSPQLGGTLESNGNDITIATGDKITLTDIPTSGTDVANKTYVDSISTDLVGDSSPQLGGTLESNGNDITIATGDKITLTDIPTSGTDAVNKTYADSISAGLDPKESVRVATTAALPAVTAAGSGVGKTLTANAVGVVTIDGQDLTAANSFAINDRILVKNQASAIDNGIYTITTLSAAGVALVLTRATDFDGTPSNEVSGGNYTFAEMGTTNADTGWVVTSDGTIIADTNAIVWSQYTGAGSFTAGLGLDQSGSTIFVKSSELTSATITTADTVSFFDNDGTTGSTDSGDRKTTISNFISDLNLTTGTKIGNVVEDVSPQLGATLDAQSFSITDSGSLTPDLTGASGTVTIHSLGTSSAEYLNIYGQTITGSGTSTFDKMVVQDEIRFEGNTGANALIQKNASTDRNELQIYTNGDAFGAGSLGAGMHLYGNSDIQHAGNIAFLTGQDGAGDGRMIISGGSSNALSDGFRTNTDTRVTIGNAIFDWVDNGNDTGMLNLHATSAGPALYFDDCTIDIAYEHGKNFDVNTWDGSSFIKSMVYSASSGLRCYDNQTGRDNSKYSLFQPLFNAGGTQEILAIRANQLIANGAGINLYGNNDTAGGIVRVYTGGVVSLEIDDTGTRSVMPGTNNTQELGIAGTAWSNTHSVIFTGTGQSTINQMVINDEIRFEGAAGTNALIQKTASTGRDQLEILATGNTFDTGSTGAGLSLIGNNDNTHAGNVTFFTGQDDVGDGRLIISGGSNNSGNPGHRTNTDTRVTIGNDILDWVDDTNDTGMLNLKGSSGSSPALYFDSCTTDIGYESGNTFDIVKWDGTTALNISEFGSNGGFKLYDGVSGNNNTKFALFQSSYNAAGTSEIFIIRANVNAASGAAINMYGSNHTNGSAFEIFTGGVISLRINATGTRAVRPGSDNTQNLGTASTRWATIYAATGTINTSDEREKTFIDITATELLVAADLKGSIKKFKWNDAIALKGEPNARIHFGTGAQTVKTIFENHGLDAFDYGVLCHDTWPDELDDDGNVVQAAGDRYGIRYDEFFAFIISAL